MELSAKQKKYLLELARSTIAQVVKTETKLPDEEIGNTLDVPGGAFVTLHKKGHLRGCIGNFIGNSLKTTVRDMASAAAFHDPRFPSLQPEELEQIDLEISVLSSLVKTKAEDIKVGKHGLYLVSPRGRGVLLPQVATEQGWDWLTFLQQTCRKAGLPSDAWQNPETQIYTFTAQIFDEKEVGKRI